MQSKQITEEPSEVKALDDYIYYLEHIRTLTKTMRPDQKEELNNIFTTLCIMMVALVKSSNMGKVSIKGIDY